jgi:uncharacterized membrane protein HdeD (DUF308 family)
MREMLARRWWLFAVPGGASILWGIVLVLLSLRLRKAASVPA